MIRLAVCSFVLLSAGWSLAASPEPRPMEGVASLHNVFQVNSNLFSGSQPEGEADFAALAALGIRTVLSVDGARPDVETARNHGLRYIHLPFGYDGVPTNRIVELTLAGSTLSGPVYVHCHHGKHRGPTAAAVLCLAQGVWTSNEAVAWLDQAGTSTNYPGLYGSVREFRLPAASVLAAMTNSLPEIAHTSNFVQAMVSIAFHHDNLKLLQQAGWQPAPAIPDLTPGHEALLLEEQLKELQRREKPPSHPAEYRQLLAESIRAAATLREALTEEAAAPARATADEAFKQVSASCVECHRRYRD